MSRRRRTPLSHARGRRELVVFGVVYLLYDASRWAFAGRRPAAAAHARWVIDLERSVHVALERPAQRVFEWSAAEWLLSNVYLAAQLIVLPASLIWLYRRSPRVYRPLRNTVVGAWLTAVPIFALFPVAPPRLAGIGLADTVSHHAAVALTGHSTIFYNPYAAVPSLHVGSRSRSASRASVPAFRRSPAPCGRPARRPHARRRRAGGAGR